MGCSSSSPPPPSGDTGDATHTSGAPDRNQLYDPNTSGSVLPQNAVYRAGDLREDGSQEVLQRPWQQQVLCEGDSSDARVLQEGGYGGQLGDRATGGKTQLTDDPRSTAGCHSDPAVWQRHQMLEQDPSSRHVLTDGPSKPQSLADRASGRREMYEGFPEEPSVRTEYAAPQQLSEAQGGRGQHHDRPAPGKSVLRDSDSSRQGQLTDRPMWARHQMHEAAPHQPTQLHDSAAVNANVLSESAPSQPSQLSDHSTAPQHHGQRPAGSRW